MTMAIFLLLLFLLLFCNQLAGNWRKPEKSSLSATAWSSMCNPPIFSSKVNNNNVGRNQNQNQVLTIRQDWVSLVWIQHTIEFLVLFWRVVNAIIVKAATKPKCKKSINPLLLISWRIISGNSFRGWERESESENCKFQRGARERLQDLNDWGAESWPEQGREEKVKTAHNREEKVERAHKRDQEKVKAEANRERERGEWIQVRKVDVGGRVFGLRERKRLWDCEKADQGMNSSQKSRRILWWK